MSGTTKPEGVQTKSGLHIPGFAQLQRLGKSLMLPIAVLPAAGILLRLGQDDLLADVKAQAQASRVRRSAFPLALARSWICSPVRSQ